MVGSESGQEQSVKFLQNTVYSTITFCPYTGDIFAIKTEDSKLKKLFTRWFKFDIHVGILSFRVITVVSV